MQLTLAPDELGVIDGLTEPFAALDRLEQAVDAAARQIALTPGEMCFIDNFRAVHGRAGFQARHDGTDRWLKRVNITRDLRRSRSHRAASDSRVVF